MKNRKLKFLSVVRRISPSDDLLFRAAMRVPERELHSIPDIAAVNFVVAFYHLTRQVPAGLDSACSAPAAEA
jgi:hypothetical protein